MSNVVAADADADDPVPRCDRDSLEFQAPQRQVEGGHSVAAAESRVQRAARRVSPDRGAARPRAADHHAPARIKGDVQRQLVGGRVGPDLPGIPEGRVEGARIRQTRQDNVGILRQAGIAEPLDTSGGHDAAVGQRRDANHEFLGTRIGVEINRGPPVGAEGRVGRPRRREAKDGEKNLLATGARDDLAARREIQTAETVVRHERRADDAAGAERRVERAVGQVAEQQQVMARRVGAVPAYDDSAVGRDLHASGAFAAAEVRDDEPAVAEGGVGRAVGVVTADRDVEIVGEAESLVEGARADDHRLAVGLDGHVFRRALIDGVVVEQLSVAAEGGVEIAGAEQRAGLEDFRGWTIASQGGAHMRPD